MFNRNIALLDLDLSNFDTSKVTEISFMFQSFAFPTINLYTFSFANIIKYETILRYSNPQLIFCINEETIIPDLKELMLDKCYDICNYCIGFGNEVNNNCTEYFPGFILIKNNL